MGAGKSEVAGGTGEQPRSGGMFIEPMCAKKHLSSVRSAMFFAHEWAQENQLLPGIYKYAVPTALGNLSRTS